jgi:hypothetical protein
MSIFDKRAGWAAGGGIRAAGEGARATRARIAHILVQKKLEKKLSFSRKI